MLAELLDRIFGSGLFGYISVRMAMATATAFVLAMAAGGPVIQWLRAHRVRESASKSDSA